MPRTLKPPVESSGVRTIRYATVQPGLSHLRRRTLMNRHCRTRPPRQAPPRMHSCFRTIKMPNRRSFVKRKGLRPKRPRSAPERRRHAGMRSSASWLRRSWQNNANRILEENHQREAQQKPQCEEKDRRCEEALRREKEERDARRRREEAQAREKEEQEAQAREEESKKILVWLETTETAGCAPQSASPGRHAPESVASTQPAASSSTPVQPASSPNEKPFHRKEEEIIGDITPAIVRSSVPATPTSETRAPPSDTPGPRSQPMGLSQPRRLPPLSTSPQAP